MAELGIITGSEVKQNLDSDKQSRVLQVRLSSDDDIQSVELYRIPGDDTHPADGTRVLVIEIGTSRAAFAASDLAVDESLEKGEREIYSTDGSERLAKLRLDKNGQLIFNDGEDWAVRFSAIETAFNDLQSKWNAFAVAYAPGSPLITGLPPTATQSDADIASAKVEKVRLP